jgi:RHS repeat-associated protein
MKWNFALWLQASITRFISKPSEDGLETEVSVSLKRIAPEYLSRRIYSLWSGPKNSVKKRGSVAYSLKLPLVLCAALASFAAVPNVSACTPKPAEYQCLGGLCIFVQSAANTCPKTGTIDEYKSCSESNYNAVLEQYFGPLTFESMQEVSGETLLWWNSVGNGKYQSVLALVSAGHDCPPPLNCTAPQVPSADGRTCITPPLNCTAPQVPSADGKTCVTPPLNCTAPEVPSADGATCITPPNPFPKDQGHPAPNTSVGEPSDAATGNEFQLDTDYRDPSGILSFARAYNSLNPVDNGLGYGWISSFGKHLAINGTSLTIYKADGSGEPFTSSGGVWQGDADTKLTLTQDATGYTVSYQDGSSERYDLTGRLLTETDQVGQVTTLSYDSNNYLSSVTGPFGRSLSFAYDSAGRLVSFTDPAGHVTQYGYDNSGNLISVTYPDGTGKQYSYTDSSFPHALTGIAYVDASGTATPFLSFVYDAAGKVATNTMAGGQQHFDLSYDSDTQTTVTDAAGNQDVLTFQTQLGVKNLLSKIVQADGKGLTQQFDARNNLISRTNADGQTTQYTYDDQNRLTSVTEAAGTPQSRTQTYQYLANGLSLPSEIDQPSVCSSTTQRTAITYGSHHNPLTITETGYTPSCSVITRTLSLGYNSAGQITQIDGPRRDVSDVTTLSYNDCQSGGACGHLKSITNALGYTTSFTQYDADGHLLQSTDANGLITSYAYDPRGRVTQITQQPASGASRTSTFTYTPSGQLAQVNFPDGRSLTYTYDDALELTQVTDNLGNSVQYGYDTRGNKTQTSLIDADGSLIRKISEVYDLRNHLSTINNGGSVTQLVVDAVGNLVQSTDPNNNPATTHSYDPLNHLIQTVDALGGVTAYDYDQDNHITQVQTPNGATTQYPYDDFGDELSEVSPDRGTTTYAYDPAGNRISKTDARGVTAHYSYDALNRLIATTYSDVPVSGKQHQPSNADISLTYDQGCSNGIGRLCKVSDQSGVTTYAYDSFGNILTETHTEPARSNQDGRILTTHYQYDAGNRIVSISYPSTNDSGRVVSYTRDGLGRITAITATVNGKTQTIVQNRSIRADGQITSQTFGNGLTDERQYTAQGQLSNWSLTGKSANDDHLYTYDANGNRIGLQEGNEQTADQYDALDRLIDENWQGSSLTAQHGRQLNDHNAYSYDANGNRLTSLRPNGNTQAYQYAPQSNRLTAIGWQSIQMDAAGNTIDDGRFQYQYDAAGRLTGVWSHGSRIASYRYNYQGLRTEKWTRMGTTDFFYTPGGHLLSERYEHNHGALHNALRDYVWDDTSPVAQIDGDSEVISNRIWSWLRDIPGIHRHDKDDQAAARERISYLHTDGMGTPRLATNAQQQVVWRWDGDAFGERQGKNEGFPNMGKLINNPQVTVNLRYPGQYYDEETGLFYNWNRYYDPNTGRYGRSDPIGLMGGGNTYIYAGGNPVMLTDPLGLWQMDYSPGQAQAWSTQQNYAGTYYQASAQAAPKTLGTVGIVAGAGALALFGQEEIAGPLVYASFVASIGGTAANAINNREFTTSDAIDAASAIAGVGAGPLARRLIQNETITSSIDFGAGLSDFMHSVNSMIQPGGGNSNLPTNGSTCSQ